MKSDEDDTQTGPLAVVDEEMAIEDDPGSMKPEGESSSDMVNRATSIFDALRKIERESLAIKERQEEIERQVEAELNSPRLSPEEFAKWRERITRAFDSLAARLENNSLKRAKVMKAFREYVDDAVGWVAFRLNQLASERRDRIESALRELVGDDDRFASLSTIHDLRLFASKCEGVAEREELALRIVRSPRSPKAIIEILHEAKHLI